ncbi:hypothetical protein NMD70_09000 [Edwardsiella tarda]|uniref:hypothetical protein n=1 Tax=Edwardsiella tarda TaxID=636 RepID=UPI0002F8259A|nr:hypothetical protein [Edwardsiella tarda]
MQAITIDLTGFYQDLAAWGVPAVYARLFLLKCRTAGGRVAMSSLMFNDTEHLTNSRHWLAASAAFWCRAYREAEASESQAQALGGIQALNQVAGMLGCGEVVSLIHLWWSKTTEVHQIPSLNLCWSSPCHEAEGGT